MFTELQIEEIVNHRMNHQRSLEEVALMFNTDRITIRKIESKYLREKRATDENK